MTQAKTHNNDTRLPTGSEYVMLEFQRTILAMTTNFLATQQKVMLAYLSRSAGSACGATAVEDAYQSMPELLSAGISLPASRTFVEPPAAEPIRQPNEIWDESEGNNGSKLVEATPPATRQRALDADELIAALVEIVSERTGYPSDMLTPTLDMEADLGIDSIKRVEILSSFRKLLPLDSQKVLEDGIERLAGVKTLQGIMDWIRLNLNEIGRSAEAATAFPEPVIPQGSEVNQALISAVELETPEKSTPLPGGVITARGARLGSAVVTHSAPGVAHFALTIDRKHDLYLSDHTFDGVPVMPMAIAIELMSEAASSLYPDWTLSALTDMEIPAGIVLESVTKNLIVTTQIQDITATVIRVKVTVSTEGSVRRTHFSAMAELTPELVHTVSLPMGIPRSFGQPQFLELLPSPPTACEIYDRIMFHGRLFQGIVAVSAMGLNGIAGELATKPISELLAKSNGESWIINPILLDSAMQLAGVWARHYLEITVLPAGFKSIRRLAPLDGTDFRALVAVPLETKGIELTCDLAVYSASGQMLLLMEGLKGIGSKALNRLSSNKTQPGAVR